MSVQLPISVIVPLSPHRQQFFDRFVHSMLKVNGPAEIIINSSEGSAAKKRNESFLQSSQPYVFFCDDDIVLPAGYLAALLAVMESNKKHKHIGYAYTGFTGIKIYDPDEKKDKYSRMVFKSPTRDFDEAALKGGRCGISTMSLLRADVFNGFDESLPRLEDLDMYIDLHSRGIIGVHVPQWSFLAFYVDRGLSFSGGNAEGFSRLRAKWGLPDPHAKIKQQTQAPENVRTRGKENSNLPRPNRKR